MAALTSSQSGNWSSSSTWGGSTPADGDTFTILQGHKVTINSDQRAGTGFGDILVRGCLHFATNGKIRINGRITVQGNGSTDYSKTNGVSAQDFTEGGSSSGALLSATGSNIVLEFDGTNSDQHGIWIENVTYSSWKFIGDDSVTTTVLESNANVEDSYLSVNDVTGFGNGDWVAIYNSGQGDYRVRSDEGCWIHDIDTSNNRIYIKKFVGPKAIVSSAASGSSLVVDHSDIFRVGYVIIFGTGSNRNVKTITSINNTTNTLTLDSGVVGSINPGTEVYETGLDKKHLSGHSVRKNAAILTNAAAVNDTTVTINNAADISVGDTINIDVNNDVDTNWDYNSEYSVTAKSGNTLTVSPAIANVRKVGSLVQRLNRSIEIKAVDSDVRAFCYVEYYTDYNRASTREIGLKDVLWNGMGGNSNNNFYRAQVFVAGYNSRYRDNEHATNSRQDYQSKYENCVVLNEPTHANYGGMNTRHTHSFMHRNCLSIYSGQRGYWQWSSHHDTQFVNNYSTRNGYASLANDGMYEANEWAYCYFTRSDDYGFMMHHNREMNPVHNIILLHHESRPMYMYYQAPNSTFKRFHIDGFRSIPYVGVGGGDAVFQDSYIQNKWYKQVPGVYAGYTDTFGIVDSSDYFGGGGGDSRANSYRGGGNWMMSQYQNWCFQENLNAVVENSYNLKFNFDGGNIWNVVNLKSEYYLVGQEIVHVPANTAVTIKGEFKGQVEGSWSYPYLCAKPHTNNALGRYQTSYTDQTSYGSSSDNDVKKSMHNGFKDEVRFDSAVGVWQQKTLNIAAQKYGYTLITGYSWDSDNQEEIGYIRDLKIIFASPPKLKMKGSRGIELSVSRKRISGRI
tara:strand:- start:848 stop:3391 length:2544 start_codon:yes stop_codon:yes gene_type:complete